MSARLQIGAMVGKHVAPPRFAGFLVLLPIAFFVHQHFVDHAKWTDSAAIAFDVASALFLVSLVPLLKQSGPDAIREHADTYDANRLLVLAMTTVVGIAVMVAIAAELPDAKQGDVGAIIRLVGTLTLIWLFANTVFAMHYAHEYYSSPDDSDEDCKGLDFPDGDEPDYTDFLYFAFTLGMTFQTSDVDITRRRLRSVSILHSFGAFIFNLGVIAFTINALGAK